MATSYTIHQAVGRPVTIKGLVGRYIIVAAASMIGDFLLFIFLYIFGLPPWFCIAFCFALGGAALWGSWALSRTYGEHGLMKKLARRGLPKSIRCGTRRTFLQLKIIYHERRTQQHTTRPGDR